MEDKEKNILQLNEDINELKANISSIILGQDSLKRLTDDNKNKIDVLEKNINSIDSENDNFIEKLRNIDGSHNVELDLSNYVTLDLLKTELRKYQKLSIDYIDSMADGGWNSDFKANLDNLNGRLAAQEDSLSFTMNKVNKFDSTMEFLSTRVEQSAEAIKSVATDYTLNEINKSITELESFRDQTARKLEDTVKRTDIDTVNNTVEEFKSKVTQMADVIDQTVTKQEIEGLTVGGKNLLENSLAISGNWEIYPKNMQSKYSNLLTFNQENGKSYFTINTNTDIEVDQIGAVSYNSFAMDYDETYTISFDFRSEKFNRLDFCYFVDSSGNYSTPIKQKYLDNDGEWHRYSFVYNQKLSGKDNTKLMLGVDKGLNQISGSFDIANVKVERGSVSSDWTPAPEDFDNMLENFNRDANQKFEHIQNNAIGLGKTVTDAFKDGLVSNAEKIAIEKQKKVIDKDKEEIDKVFNTLYSNIMISNNSKQKLKNDYDTFNEKYNILLQSIQNAIQDGVATKEEIAQFDTNYLRYNEAQSNVKNSIQEAIDSISNNYAVTEASKISIGGNNLVSVDNIDKISGTTDINKSKYVSEGLLNATISGTPQGFTFKLDKVKNRLEHVISFNLEKQIGSITDIDINIPNSETTDVRINSRSVSKNSRNISIPNSSSLINVEVVFIPNDSFTTNTVMSFYINRYGSSFPINVDVEGFKAEQGNKGTAWQPSLSDTNSKITNLESRINQTEKSIDLSVSKTVYNADKTKIEQMGTALSMLADGITMSASNGDKLSTFNIDPYNIKLNSRMIDINDGDVIIKDGKASINEASIKKLMTSNVMIQTVMNEMGKVDGGLTIKRPDGGYLVYNGMPRFTTAYIRPDPTWQSLMPNGEPRFKNVGNMYMFSDRTAHGTFRRCMTFYGQHETRYLHIGFWYATPQCGIDIMVDSFNEHNGVIFEKVISIPKDTSTSVMNTKFRGTIVDLGMPKQSLASVAIKVRVKDGQKGNAWIRNSYVYGRN